MTSNTIAIGISLALIGSALAWTNLVPHTAAQTVTPEPVTVDAAGIQHITLTAKSGYHPKEVVARAGASTTLTFITDNTFDCSASLLIPSLTYKTQLPPTGTTTIALGTHTAGEEITGACSTVGIGFKIRFE